MIKLKGKCKFMMWLLTIVSVVFGIVTIKSGGQVLFGDEIYRIQAGNYVPHVLWFNFVAGFIYVIAGLGLLLQRKISVVLPWGIALSTLFIYAMLGNFIRLGGLYEMRTIYAMGIRFGFWSFVSLFVYMKFWRKKDE